jgi:hypothetical protein
MNNNNYKDDLETIEMLLPGIEEDIVIDILKRLNGN